MSWRFVNAAVRGTSHVSAGTVCQDDCFVDVFTHEGKALLLAIAADGAGSASCAEEGSGLVCETLTRSVERWHRDGGTLTTVTRETVEQWIGGIRAAIETRASQKELTPRDFACTLLAAIVDESRAAFVQIGDGAIVADRNATVADNTAAYEVIFWPDGGEYANMTFFVTDEDWSRHLHFEIRDAVVEELALMTDGLQRLALQFETRSAHAPFFAPMFGALRRAAPGFASDLEPALVAFLGSDAVNARTDDDKSLVLATRRPGVDDGAL